MMGSKGGAKNVDSANKHMICKGLTSASASTITSQGNSGFVQQRANARATSAKYYDIASKIIGGSGDVEELFLTSAKNGIYKKLEQLLQQSSEIGLNINCTDKRTGNTALIWASKRGHSKVAALLLRHGADATVCNYETHTALETAFSPAKTVILDWIEGQEEINERLLLQAAWQGNVSIVRKILQNKSHINVNCQNAEGLTPLMLVCRDMQLFERLVSQLNKPYNPVQVAEELIKHKADILVTDSDGRSCLHYAAQSHSASADSLTLALVAGGFNMELCDKHLLTPLHLASQSGNTNTVVVLAEKGSDVNAKGFAGLTPLHMTALKDHHITAVTLLKHNADVTIVDDHGLTPLDMARSRKMKNLLKEAWLAATKVNNPPQDDITSVSLKTDPDEGAKKPEVAIKSGGAASNTSKAATQPKTNKANHSMALSNVDRCRQVERKILQDVAEYKAAHPTLQREATRILGTPRANILPQIRRSSSPEPSNSLSKVNDSKSSASKVTEGLQRSLEETQNKLPSRGRSVLDARLERANKNSSTACVNQETTKDLYKSANRRSNCDHSTPHIRDLAASCDNLLACTNGKRMVKIKNNDLSLSKALSASCIKIQKEPQPNEKGSPHQENILSSMGSPSEMKRSHSIFKEEFILEESRPKEILSGSDPASSLSSQSSSSPRDLSFIQPSPSRAMRHDTSLSTLLEQQASTHFSVLDSFTNNDGKPLILKPHKKLRKRSDNSLSSSLESDTEDLRMDKVIARSDSLRRSIERISSTNLESTNLSNPLFVFKSHSLESISSTARPKALEESLTSSSVTVKSNSDGNLDAAEKDPMQTTKSKLCETAENKNPGRCKPPQSAAKCLNPSTKIFIEPFTGKAKVASSTKIESLGRSSPSIILQDRIIRGTASESNLNVTQNPSKYPLQNSCGKVSLTDIKVNSFCTKSSTGTGQDQRQERKLQERQSNPAPEVRPVLVNTNDSVASTTEASKLQLSQAIKNMPTAADKSTPQEQSKPPETVPKSDHTAQPDPGNKSIDVHSSSSSLKSASGKQFNPSISGILQALVTRRQSHSADKACGGSRAKSATCEKSDKPEDKSNQKIDKLDSLDKSKTKEAFSMKEAVKQSYRAILDGTKDKADKKEVFLKSQKKSPTNQGREITNELLFDTTVPTVCASDETNYSVTVSNPLDQSSPNTSTTVTSLRSAASHDKETCSEKTKELSEKQKEPGSSEKCKKKDQDFNKMTLNIMKHFYPSRSIIQLKTMSVEPLASNELQLPAARTNEPSDRKEMSSDYICTPVIVNPFEGFVQAHIKVVDNSTDELVAVKKPNFNKFLNKNVKKAATSLSRKKLSSGILRQVSAGRKHSAKSKDIKVDKEPRPKTGRKSAKVQQNKKTEKISKSKINMNPNNVLTTQIDCQMPASRNCKSVTEPSSDLNQYSSDSDFSLDLDELESLPPKSDFITGKASSKNCTQAFGEDTTEDTNIFREQSSHAGSVLKTKQHVVTLDSLSDGAQELHTNSEQKPKTKNPLTIDEKNQQFSDHISLLGRPVSSEFSKATPISEQFNLVDASVAASASDMTDENVPLQHGGIPPYENQSHGLISVKANANIEYLQDVDSHVHRQENCQINTDVEDKMAANYEYMPSNKIVKRTQSLKEFKKHSLLKDKHTLEKNHDEKVVAEKIGNENDDIDDIIEEIFSSMTSSVASTTRNMKAQGLSPRVAGVHSVTDSDRTILLKMSSSKFSSPFHAKIPATAKVCSEDLVDDLSEENVSPRALPRSSKLSSSIADADSQIRTSQDLQPPSTNEVPNLTQPVAVLPSSKPKQSSFKEAGVPRPVTVRRSSSSREGRRLQISSKNGIKATDEEAQQLAKILSSFKLTELQVGANCGDRSPRSMLGCEGQSAVFTGLSFTSKRRFQEMKAYPETRISTESTDAPATGLNKDSHDKVPGGQNTLDDFKCEDGHTIQWKKGNVLGRGAFGTVWCGLTSEGQLIAVKQIELTTMDKSKAQHEYENVQGEVDILKTLEHENIVSYLGTSLEENIVSIFMQFIPGGSIASILARFGALEESVFRIYTKQILEGVKYLHSNDVIHRDIKGANVMLMHNGVIKLIDFGCAKKLCFNLSISKTELLKSMNGTPFWMAPEVVNESGHGKKSDIWSIGCTVFEMATIKPPWADMNPMAAIFAIGSPSRPVPTLGRKFSHDARDFVSRCMTRDQDTRPGASELQEHPFITRHTNTRPYRTDLT